MHVQYQLHPMGRNQITSDDVRGVVSFLNNADGRYSAAICDYEHAIIDVAHLNGGTLQLQELDTLRHFCYHLKALTADEFNAKMKRTK